MNEWAEYKCEKVTFILTPTKLAVETSLQFFILSPVSEQYHRKRWEVIRMLIEGGQITSISELADYSDGKLSWNISERKRLQK